MNARHHPIAPPAHHSVIGPRVAGPHLGPVPFLDLGWQHREVADEVRAGFEAVLASGAFVGGPAVTRFEDAFAAACGVDHCVGVANGTDAIELALRALGIGSGSTVAVPANTFIATAEAAWRCGARVVFVDVDPVHLLMDPGSLDDVCARHRPDAVIPVDLYGQIAPIEELGRIAQSHGAALIEDAAQSQGALRFGRGIGHGVALATTSFYPGKNLGAYGDGGAVVTRSPELAERVRLIANHGSRVRYQHEVPGMNSRLDALQAVVLSAKLARLEGWNERRRSAARRYDELIESVDGVSTVPTMHDNTPVWHLYVIQTDERDQVVEAMLDRGVNVAIHYPVPVHRTPAFAAMNGESFPVAEAAAARILSLPMFPGITADQQVRVISTLQSVISDLRRDRRVSNEQSSR